MKRLSLILTGFAFCALVAVSLAPAFSAPQKSGAADDYAIYSAVINSLYVKKNIKFVVIKASTVSYNEVQLRKLKNDMPRVKSSFKTDALEGFVQRNIKSMGLERKFSLKAAYGFFEFDKMATHEQWTAFFKQFPKARGAVSLTNPGFSKDGAKAFLLVTYQIYVGLGEEWALQLSKKGKSWVITDKYLLFKS